jgi:hypothetical protein
MGPKPLSAWDATWLARHVRYAQDDRTGLCFAVAGYHGYGTAGFVAPHEPQFDGIALTHVYCTPEVMRLVDK